MYYSNETDKNSEVILIVDDNHHTSAFIEFLLTEAGYSCVVTDTGFKAFEVVKNQKIDLVLLDVVMPDIDGLTAAPQLKAIAGNEFLPIILVTALCTDEDKVAGLTYADGYITKPFSNDELLARIGSLLRIRRLHDELSRSKKKYESLYENFPHLYLSIDAQRNIIDCNRFFRQTFNVTKEGVTGKSILMFFKTEDHSVLENFFNSLIISEASCVQQRIFSMVSPEKNDTLMANLKAVYIDNNETGISLVIAMEDVTKQLQLEEEQKIARKQLYRSARLASIGTLSSGVAHELNNPLTAILGFSSAILDRFKNDENTPSGEMEQFLGIINQEAIRCKGIIETLSKFANDGIMQVKDILLCDCINDALALTKSKAARSNIMIKNSLSQTIFVKADVNKLEQVFVNVLSNCLDFCPENCTVDITAVLSRDPVRYFALSISDNGPGISIDDLPNVFDPFFTTKEVGQGTGMGLAICHKLMEECDGRIDILSEKGKGTTVIIEMPLGSNEFEFMESR